MRLHAAGLTRAGVVLWVLYGLAGAAEDISRPPAGGVRAVSAPDATGPLYNFDLPAQSLAEALKRYANLTRQPTLVRGEFVAGRTSSAVRGAYPPDIALRLLLQGTGLVAERIQVDPTGGFVLKQADAAAVATPRADSLGDLAGYPGLVQARVWQALCGDPRTAPGAYRSLLRFQIDATGQIQRVRLLGSTGDGGRDAAVQATLQAVRMDRPPPPSLPQPLTLFIEPHHVSGGPLCGRGVS